MSSLLRRVRTRSVLPAEMSLSSYLEVLKVAGQSVHVGLSGAKYSGTMAGSPAEVPDGSFDAYVAGVHRRSGVVASAVVARGLLMGQIHPKWRSQVDGSLFGNEALLPLEEPFHTTRSYLFSQAENHVSYSGNAYFRRTRRGVELLPPDNVSLLIGSTETIDEPVPLTELAEVPGAAVIGYWYRRNHRDPGTVYFPDEVAHWAPEPDPGFRFRGESWVTSVLREISLDGQASDHLRKFFENAATPNLSVSYPVDATEEQYNLFREAMASKHEGVDHAYKTLLTTGGADVRVIGEGLDKLDLRHLTGGFESRIASRARVPAAILGIREGLQGSALNSGNYGQTRRQWADGWFSPHSDSMLDPLKRILDAPAGADLSQDPGRIQFLQEDRKDEAEIAQANAATLRQLVDAGFDPASAVEAVKTGDLSKLSHSGLVSVQLLPPGTTGDKNITKGETNDEQ